MRAACLALLAWVGLAQASLLVQSKEQRSDEKWTQPQLVMVNVGEAAVAAPVLVYRVKVLAGQVPELQWFDPSSGVSASLEAEADNVYAVRMAFPGLVLAPGERHNYGNGVKFGLHLPDWSVWNLLDDPSYKGPDGNLVVNENIQVYYGSASSSSTATASSSSFSVPGSSSSGSLCSAYWYDGTNAKHVLFAPYDWPEPYELLTNHGILAGAMQPPYLRLSGSKSFADDWKSIYRFSQPVDLSTNNASFQLYSTGIGSWSFRLVDADQGLSAPLSIALAKNTMATVILSATELAAAGFNAKSVTGIVFEAVGVAAWQYSHTYIDNIQAGCATAPASSSSAGTSSSSSASAGPKLLVRVAGDGSVKPGTLLDFPAGKTLQLWFEPGISAQMGSLTYDGVLLSLASSLQLVGDGQDHILDVWFEPNPGNMRVLQVNVADGGKANMEGGYLVALGSTHTLMLYPDPGYRVGAVRVNGVLVGDASVMALGPIQADTKVDVQFAPVDQCPIALLTEGPGALELVGTPISYCGETRTVKVIPQAGADLLSLRVGGQSHEPVPFMQVGPLTAAVEVKAVFGAGTTVACPLDVRSLHRSGYTEVSLRNQSSDNLEAGWFWDYYLRTGAGQQPAVSGWYTPGLSYETKYLGDGYWRTRFTATQSLGVQTQLMAQFGLALQDNSLPWPQSSDWSAGTGTDQQVANGKIPVYNAQGQHLCGAWPLPGATPDTYSIRVQSYENGCPDKYLQPRISVTNTGTGIISGFYYLYYFKAEAGRIPLIDAAWYNPHSSVSLLSFGNGWYALRYDYPQVTLLPGQTLPGDNATNVVGIHYVDWVPVNRDDDYSFNGACTEPPVVNPNIPVYTYDGRLIGGTEPTSIGDETDLRILRHPADVTVEEGQSATFSVVVAASAGLNYRWMKNGVFIAGATGSSYTLDKALLSDNGNRYSVEIADHLGRRVVSASALLTVLRQGVAPFFVIDLADKTVRVGDPVVFAVEARSLSGDGVQYQWYVNGQVQAATGSQLDMGAALLGMDKSRIKVVAVAGGRSMASREVGLRVLPYVSASGRITLSGQLRADSGVVSGVKSFTVRLFSSKTGTEPLYVERFWKSNGMGVTIQNGFWSLQLGTGDSEQSLANAIASSKNLYVEIWAGQPAYQELTGERQPLDAVFRTLRATQKQKGE